MSSRTASGRHRAAPVHNNPLAVISQAVSSNAGSVGRQAAVIAAASGLALSVGVPAAAGAERAATDITTVTAAASAERAAAAVTAVTAAQGAPGSVSVPAEAKISFERAAVNSEAAPAATATVTAQANEAEEVSTPAAAEPAAAVEEAAEPEPKPEPAAAVSSGNSSVAGAAYAGIGNPYVYGGTSTSGWDCSGFVQWAYGQAGVNLPRTNQWSAMTPTGSPKAGDLVVQNGGAHVGIYVGNGQMISALNPSDGTQLHSVNAMPVSGYYTLP